ncbi:MAG: glycosyltransferase family 2 protein [Elusimicrobia bacterium]|nr:glycosyltransferase family 2 protein [Elusimicrobiota bacterium]
MTEISVVIPCLNEEKTIASCIKRARESFLRANLSGEIIVVDNGSSDRTVEIAQNAGAVVISELSKGYGNALIRGIKEAKGEYIVMGDGDNTYDFSEIDKFVMKLKEGNDLAMGSRFKGKILPGAMTWSHQYIGNPILSGMLRLFFGGTISDSHCGLRAFTKDAFKKMNLHTTGMEFASEMVIHALKKKLKISEIPITYYTRAGESKLASFRDAWRHIRFMLLYSPGYLFLAPGLAIFTISFIATIKLAFGPIYAFGRNWDVHPMVFFSMFTLLGWQILSIGIAGKAYANEIGLEEDKMSKKIIKFLSLEKVLIFGIFLIILGLALIIYIFYVWALSNFGVLSEVKTGILALLLTGIGLQTIFTAFLISMLQIKYR